MVIIYMSNLLDKKFEQLNTVLGLSEQSKQKIKRGIFNHNQHSQYLLPKFITILASFFLIGLTYILVDEKTDKSTSISSEIEETIIDSHTPEALPKITASEHTFTIEWLFDSMDRGNHDLDTNVHGKLVISEEVEPVNRGDIVYYEMDQQQIGRIIGLPGETVEIREGQIYINKKKLNTFYGVATSMGLTKEEYFKKVDPVNRNTDAMLEHFNTTIEPVYINKDRVFILVDNWWRGKDSRVYGSIPIKQLNGKILGYEK